MECRINGTIIASRMRAEICTYRWFPGREELTQLPREDYSVSRRVSGNEKQIHVHSKQSSSFRASGSLILVPPGCPITWRSETEETIQILNCVFDRSFFEDVTGHNGNWSEEYLDVYFDIKNASLDSTMRRIQHEITEPGFAGTALIEGASNFVLVDVARYLQRVLRNGPQQREMTGGLTSWQLRRIRERVESSLEYGCPSLDELAKLCGLSQNWMMRKFKVSVGITPHRYLEDICLKIAERLLAGGNHSCKEIAFLLGFSSTSAFSVAFRRLTAMTPSEFRRRSKWRN